MSTPGEPPLSRLRERKPKKLACDEDFAIQKPLRKPRPKKKKVPKKPESKEEVKFGPYDENGEVTDAFRMRGEPYDDDEVPEGQRHNINWQKLFESGLAKDEHLQQYNGTNDQLRADGADFIHVRYTRIPHDIFQSEFDGNFRKADYFVKRNFIYSMKDIHRGVGDKLSKLLQKKALALEQIRSEIDKNLKILIAERTAMDNHVLYTTSPEYELIQTKRTEFEIHEYESAGEDGVDGNAEETSLAHDASADTLNQSSNRRTTHPRRKKRKEPKEKKEPVKPSAFLEKYILKQSGKTISELVGESFFEYIPDDTDDSETDDDDDDDVKVSTNRRISTRSVENVVSRRESTSFDQDSSTRRGSTYLDQPSGTRRVSTRVLDKQARTDSETYDERLHAGEDVHSHDEVKQAVKPKLKAKAKAGSHALNADVNMAYKKQDQTNKGIYNDDLVPKTPENKKVRGRKRRQSHDEDPDFEDSSYYGSENDSEDDQGRLTEGEREIIVLKQRKRTVLSPQPTATGSSRKLKRKNRDVDIQSERPEIGATPSQGNSKRQKLTNQPSTSGQSRSKDKKISMLPQSRRKTPAQSSPLPKRIQKSPYTRAPKGGSTGDDRLKWSVKQLYNEVQSRSIKKNGLRNKVDLIRLLEEDDAKKATLAVSPKTIAKAVQSEKATETAESPISQRETSGRKQLNSFSAAIQKMRNKTQDSQKATEDEDKDGQFKYDSDYNTAEHTRTYVGSNMSAVPQKQIPERKHPSFSPPSRPRGKHILLQSPNRPNKRLKLIVSPDTSKAKKIEDEDYEYSSNDTDGADDLSLDEATPKTPTPSSRGSKGALSSKPMSIRSKESTASNPRAKAKDSPFKGKGRGWRVGISASRLNEVSGATSSSVLSQNYPSVEHTAGRKNAEAGPREGQNYGREKGITGMYGGFSQSYSAKPLNARAESWYPNTNEDLGMASNGGAQNNFTKPLNPFYTKGGYGMNQKVSGKAHDSETQITSAYSRDPLFMAGQESTFKGYGGRGQSPLTKPLDDFYTNSSFTMDQNAAMMNNGGGTQNHLPNPFYSYLPTGGQSSYQTWGTSDSGGALNRPVTSPNASSMMGPRPRVSMPYGGSAHGAQNKPHDFGAKMGHTSQQRK